MYRPFEEVHPAGRFISVIGSGGKTTFLRFWADCLPGTVILTTPNREYNVNYEKLEEDKLRHGDHRFEWTREEFRLWTEHVCSRFGYSCVISGIGENDEAHGQPTQMGVFTKNG